MVEFGEENSRLGAAEGIDALLDVADNEDIVAAAYGVDDSLLNGVYVLVLIYENVLIFLSQGFCDIAFLGQDFQGEVLEVGEVETVDISFGEFVKLIEFLNHLSEDLGLQIRGAADSGGVIRIQNGERGDFFEVFFCGIYQGIIDVDCGIGGGFEGDLSWPGELSDGCGEILPGFIIESGFQVFERFDEFFGEFIEPVMFTVLFAAEPPGGEKLT